MSKTRAIRKLGAALVLLATLVLPGVVFAGGEVGSFTLPLTTTNGGTGIDTSGNTDGQILIGKTSTHAMALANITGTANRVTVTNGANTISLNGPQDLATGSSPQFLILGLGTAAVANTTLTTSESITTTSGTVNGVNFSSTFLDGGTTSTSTPNGVQINLTANFTAASRTGGYTGLRIAATETSLGTGSNNLIDGFAGAAGTTEKFNVGNTGIVGSVLGFTSADLGMIGWNSNPTAPGGTPTTAFSRIADGSAALGTGAQGDFSGLLKLSGIALGNVALQAQQVSWGTGFTHTQAFPNFPGATDSAIWMVGGSPAGTGAGKACGIAGGVATTTGAGGLCSVVGGAATGSNQNAGGATVDAGPSTGTGTCTLALNVSPIGASSSTANVSTTFLQIKGNSIQNGSVLTYSCIRASTTLSTAGTTTNTAIVPANSYVLGVTARITTTITTATNWKVSDAAAANTYIAVNSTLTSGTTATGMIFSATTYYNAANTFLITTTGTPGAGVLEVIIYYCTMTPPTS